MIKKVAGHKLWLLLLVLLGTVNIGFADTPQNMFDMINNSFSLDATIVQQHLASDAYRENGIENNFAPGFNTNITKTFFKHLYINPCLDLNWSNKNIGSKKQYSLGALGAKAGYVFDGEILQTIPYMSFDFIHRETGYLLLNIEHESAANNYKAAAGVKLNWILTNNLILSPSCDIGLIKVVSMHTKAKSGDFIRSDRLAYQTGIEANYLLDNKVFLNGFINYLHINGNKTLFGEHYIPDNSLNLIKVGVGVKLGF